MSTKTMKILTTVATILLIIAMGTSIVYGLSPNEIKAGDTVTGSEQIKTFGQKLIGILQAAGIVISVIILTVLGIKYMIGSAEEKAEYKKTMIPYIVGAVFIFAAPTIANIVYSFVNSF